VIGCAIEGASSEKYVDFVRENVFRPAGMTVTPWDDRLAVIAHRTRFYSKAKSGVVENANFLDASYKIPGGGWLSSADDMAKFEIAILSDQLMKRTTRDVMWTSRPLLPRPGAEHTGYALGWGNSEIDGATDYDHDGCQQGTSTSIIVIPERNAGVVVLINMDGLDASKLATEVMKLVIGHRERVTRCVRSLERVDGKACARRSLSGEGTKSFLGGS